MAADCNAPGPTRTRKARFLAVVVLITLSVFVFGHPALSLLFTGKVSPRFPATDLLPKTTEIKSITVRGFAGASEEVHAISLDQWDTFASVLGEAWQEPDVKKYKIFGSVAIITNTDSTLYLHFYYRQEGIGIRVSSPDKDGDYYRLEPDMSVIMRKALFPTPPKPD